MEKRPSSDPARATRKDEQPVNSSTPLLAEKARLFEAVMAYLPDGIAIADAPDAVIRHITAHGLRMMGRPEQDIVRVDAGNEIRMAEHFHASPATPAHVQDLPLLRSVHGAEVVTGEEWMLEHPDGTRIAVLCSAAPILDDQGTVTGGVMAWHDVSRLKQMEQLAGESRRRLQEENGMLTNVFATAPFFLVVLRGKEHLIEMANPAAVRLFGGRAVVGRPMAEVISEVGPDRLSELLDQVHTTGEVVVASKVLVPVDGQVPEHRMLNLALNPVCEPDGTVTGIHLYGTDVTEDAQARADVQAEEARLRAVLEDALDAAYRRDLLADRYDYVSPVIEQITGFTPEEYESMSIDEALLHVHPDDRQRVNAGIEQSIRTGSGTLEYQFLHKDGTYRWLADHFAIRKDAEGRPLFRAGIVRDISERKEVEMALRESEERFRTSVESMIDAFGIYSSIRDEEDHIVDFRVDYVNEAACAINGMSRQEQVGRRLLDILPAHRDTGLFASYCRVVETGESFQTEAFRYEDEFGRRRMERVFNIQAAKLGDGFVASWSDVTQRTLNEEKLQQQGRELRDINRTLERRVAERTAELEERNHELQNFAFVASHDLREPLRKVQAFGDLLQDEFGEQLGDEGGYLLWRMRSAAARMDALLKDLLDFSRVATHKRPYAPVRLDEVVADVLRDYELAIRKANAEVEVRAAVTIEADAAQLRQLMTNLIGNALKFRRPEVVPSVQVEATLVSREALGLDVDAAVCRITVEDNGIGFEEKYRTRIFEPFERLHGRSAYEGTGMGLALCRRIVEGHGGRITAESTPGEGSCFVVLLPAQRPNDDPSPSR